MDYKVIEQYVDDSVWYSATKIDRTNEEVVADGIRGYTSGSHPGPIWQKLYDKGYVHQNVLFDGLSRSEANKIKKTLIDAAVSRYNQVSPTEKVMVLNEGGKYI